MADDIVYLSACSVQGRPGSLIFFLAGQLLLPPGAVVHPVQRSAGVQPSELLLKQRTVRFQDTSVNVVAAGPAHGKEGLTLDLIDLAPHQVNHRGVDTLNLAAVPLLHGIFRQKVKVFVVARDE